MTSLHEHPEPPKPSAVADQLFGSRLPLAQRYVAHLATTGVQHGLIGPREVPRLWERHVLNCAILTDLLPMGTSVADVGSGAGLPGIALAVRRPDLQITLIEPLLRRVTWLDRVVADLGLTTVMIRRGRAQDVADDLRADVVTARAVAPLERLSEWSLPLLAPGGRLLALKGQSAGEEIERSTAALSHLGLRAELAVLGEQLLDEPTRVAVVTRCAKSVHQPTTQPKRTRRARRPS